MTSISLTSPSLSSRLVTQLIDIHLTMEVMECTALLPGRSTQSCWQFVTRVGCHCVVTPRAARTYWLLMCLSFSKSASHRCCCCEIKSIHVWHRSLSAHSSTTSSRNHVVAGFADHVTGFADHVVASIEHHVLAGSEDQCNGAQRSTMQHNTAQYNAMQCNAMQCNAMQCNAMQCNAMQCNAMQCKTLIPTRRNCSLAVLTGS